MKCLFKGSVTNCLQQKAYYIILVTELCELGVVSRVPRMLSVSLNGSIFFFCSQLRNTAIHRLCPQEKNSCFEVLFTSEKSKHASGHHELTLWTWGGTWVLGREVGGKVREFPQLFPLLPPQLFGLGVDAHPYSRWGAGQRACVGKWTIHDCSWSPTHAPAMVVQHETFDSLHKRFPSYESYFLKKWITSEHRT